MSQSEVVALRELANVYDMLGNECERFGEAAAASCARCNADLVRISADECERPLTVSDVESLGGQVLPHGKDWMFDGATGRLSLDDDGRFAWFVGVHRAAFLRTVGDLKDLLGVLMRGGGL